MADIVFNKGFECSAAGYDPEARHGAGKRPHYLSSQKGDHRGFKLESNFKYIDQDLNRLFQKLFQTYL